jgi:hypothetical protein
MLEISSAAKPLENKPLSLVKNHEFPSKHTGVQVYTRRHVLLPTDDGPELMSIHTNHSVFAAYE